MKLTYQFMEMTLLVPIHIIHMKLSILHDIIILGNCVHVMVALTIITSSSVKEDSEVTGTVT